MVIINSHREAVTTARAFANETSANPSLLLVVGSAGVGKTELVRSMMAVVCARGRRRIHVLSARDLALHFVEALRRNTFDKISCQFGRPDFVAIEDVSDLRGKPATLEELGRVTAQWVAAGAHVVCTAGCSLQEVVAFEQRLPPSPASRVVMLATPTRSDMRANIKALARSAGIDIDRQSLVNLAAWCGGDIRRAVGAIRQLAFQAAYAGGRSASWSASP